MNPSTFGDLRLLPDDYHRQVAKELAAFFHIFYRFGGVSNRFDLNDAVYVDFLKNILVGSMCIGAVVFLVLCVIVVRRTILHIRSAAAQRTSMTTSSMELLAVGMLTFLAISALGGLLGEGQVDYSAGVVFDTMMNTSELFKHTRELTEQNLQTSNAVRFHADHLITTFNDTELPADAFKMSVEAMRLVHASKDLWHQSDTLLPKNYSEIVQDLEFRYFLLKSSTNGAILAVALASLLSIASIGWALVSPLRVSMFILLSVIPISHTLVGAYLASTIMTADFCAAPINSTLEIIGTAPLASYYVECPANASMPFGNAVVSVGETASRVMVLQRELELNATHQGEIGRRMKIEFLDPIGKQLNSLDTFLSNFASLQTCTNVSNAFEVATTTFCEFGMLGFFSMWVHQIMLCLILFVSVVVSVLVYERVHMREVNPDIHYQLIPSYEEDGMEHVYLSSD
ncbi:hypothetical protein CCR75_006808 [Bremia lactucae]|uniref:Uncharacterized protein n=1 Tax=Bremia lactucae TaxID=4779 RepID=A0A976FLI6_BRELC|nr:hypothetical protein CCR75_006808 [Bremia lactucae]